MKTFFAAIQFIGAMILFAAVIYYIFASTVFSLRHPWMTKTEKLVYSWQMLTFGEVSYEEARPRH